MLSVAVPLSGHPMCPAIFRLSKLCLWGSWRDFIKCDELHHWPLLSVQHSGPYPESVQHLLKVDSLEQEILSHWTF